MTLAGDECVPETDQEMLVSLSAAVTAPGTHFAES
jgi:hypothetical protein